MIDRTLDRASGGILIAGAALTTAGYVLGAFGPSEGSVSASVISSPLVVTSTLATFIGSVLVLVMLPALVARQFGRAPLLSVLGAIGAGLVLLIQGVCNSFIDATVFPWLIENPATRDLANGAPPAALGVAYTVGMVGALVGGIVLGIAVLRARVLPRSAGVLLILSGALGPLSMLLPPAAENLGAVLGGLGLLGCGIGLFGTTHTEAAPLPSGAPA